MIITYDVFNENVGTIGRYKSFIEASQAFMTTLFGRITV